LGREGELEALPLSWQERGWGELCDQYAEDLSLEFLAIYVIITLQGKTFSFF
jgi:hypothetical protein